MLYLRLAGGLGNQLYQLAAASLLSQTTGVRVVPLLEGLIRYQEPRAPDSIELLQPSGWLRTSSSEVPAIWNGLALRARAGRWMPLIGVSDHNFWPMVIAGGGKNRILDGYFQQGWTAETFSRAIDQMQAHPISIAAAARISADEVVIHIRGGDFLKLPQYQVVDSEFYVRAAQQAMKRGLNRFAIMSDDQPYAQAICEQIRKHLSRVHIRLIPKDANTLQDFDTLRAATARIIGNSTFSWWATVYGAPLAPTWSPTKLTIYKRRNFFLRNEIPIGDNL